MPPSASRPWLITAGRRSSFTGRDFTGALKDADVAISMDGRGRYMDNIFIERLWRSLKYEAVYLHERMASRPNASLANRTTPSGPIRRPRLMGPGGPWI